MIHRIDSPQKANFSTVEGTNKPYFSRYVTPISRLTYVDSIINNQKAPGSIFWYQKDDSGNFVNVFSGSWNLMKFYNPAGIPETILNPDISKQWSAGYFMPFKFPITGTYNFYFAGNGFVKISKTFGGYESTLKTIRLDANSYATAGPFNYLANDVDYFTIEYRSPEQLNDIAAFMGMWQVDSASVTPEKILISNNMIDSVADAFNITNYNNVNYSEKEDGISSLTFEIPLIRNSTSYNYGGYYYNSTTDSYVEKLNGNSLKKDRQIQWFEGYKSTAGATELIQKFTGKIASFEATLNANNEDSIKVTCQDYSSFTRETINLMSPTELDYWEAGIIDDVNNVANGRSKPRTFDGWPIHKVFQIACTNSYLDPYNFYQKKLFNGYTNSTVVGGYYVEPLLSSVQSKLPVPVKYGKPSVTSADLTNADDQYLYSFNTGEKYKDAIDSLFKSYYYKWNLNRYGYPQIKRVNVPNTIVNDRSFSKTSFTDSLSVNALKGTYTYGLFGARASCNATGKHFTLVLGAGPQCGSSNPSVATMKVKIRKGSTIVSSVTYNTYSSTARFSYDGPISSSGVNPCYLNFGNNLNYDTYRIIVENVCPTPAKQLRLEGLLAFEEEYNYPQEVYYTNKSIQELNVNADIENHRNEAIVLGKRTGTQVINENGKGISPVNPNNPISTYIQSAARDLRSIYVSTASNYIGRPRTTVVIDPSISTQEQADFVAFNLVDEYGSPKKEVRITVAGNPKVEVGDPISVADVGKNTLSSAYYLWVTEINNTFQKNTYKTNLTLTPYKPLDSFWNKPEPSLSDYGNNPIYNVRIRNRGLVGYLTATVNTVSTSFVLRYLNSTVNGAIPTIGYGKIGTEHFKYNGFQYSPASSGYNITLHNVTRGLNNSGVGIQHRGTINKDLLNGYAKPDMVVIGYDPYNFDAVGGAPYIEFDTLVSGLVDVSVYSSNKDADQLYPKAIQKVAVQEIKIDSLSGIGSEGYPEIGYDQIDWGSNRRYIWGGFDQLGNYNRAVSAQDYGAGFFAAENIKVPHWLYSATAEANGRNTWSIVNNSTSLHNSSASFGHYFFKIRLIPFNNPKQIYEYNSKDQGLYDGYIISQLGQVGTIDVRFDTAGLYFTTSIPTGFTKNLEFTRTVNDDFSRAKQASTYPFIRRGALEKHPVFCQNKSNSYQGFKFSLYDYDSVKVYDPDRRVTYFPNLYVNIVQLSAYGNIAYSETQSVLITEDLNSNLFYSSDKNKSYYFSLQNLQKKNKDFRFIPPKVVKNFLAANLDANGLYRDNTLYVANYLYFNGSPRDLSGRPVRQPRHYQVNYPPNSPAISPALDIVPDLSKVSTPFIFTGTANFTQRGWYTFEPPQGTDSWKYRQIVGYYPGNPPADPLPIYKTRIFSFDKNFIGELEPNYDYFRSHHSYSGGNFNIDTSNVANGLDSTIPYLTKRGRIDYYNNRANVIHWWDESVAYKSVQYSDSEYNGIRGIFSVYDTQGLWIPNYFFTFKPSDFV